MSFEPFTIVRGPAIPLMRSNVDTDVIIRIERMTVLPPSAWGQWALEALRYKDDGALDLGSVLNQPQFNAAPILLAGPNFGCGSSREPAVTALQGLGLRCIIAPSFGDIFFANCFQNGMLPIELPLAQVEQLARQADDGTAMTVDLTAKVIEAPDGVTVPFEVEPLRREALLNGLDDIGLTMKEESYIAAWQAADRLRRPWAWPRPG